VASGFGAQYLLWPVPYLLLLRRRAGLVYAAVAGAYGTCAYLPLMGTHDEWYVTFLQWTSLPVLAVAVAAVPWALRHGEPDAEVPRPRTPDEDTGRPDPNAVTGSAAVEAR
jgi:hypothetical protein